MNLQFSKLKSINEETILRDTQMMAILLTGQMPIEGVDL